MAIDDILRSIEEECEMAVAEIKERSVFQAQQIIAEAEEKAELVKSETLQREKEKIAAESAEIINAAKIQAKRITSEAAEKVIEDAFCELETKLFSLQGDGKKMLFQKIMKDIFAAFENSNEPILKVRKNDEKLIREILKEMNATAEVISSNDIKGGIMASNADEKLMVNGTIELIMEKARKELRSEVYKELF